MKIEKILKVGTFLIFPVLFFCTTVDFSDIDDLVQKPSITIPGDNPDTISLGDNWSKPSDITAFDETDGDITSQITDSGSVNVNEEGSYQIVYKVKNSKGVEVAKTLTVVVINNGGSDTEDPVITISGNNPDTITVGSSWNKPAVTANDNKDGDLTSSIISTGSVDNNKVGTYTITYTVSDKAGNEATKELIVVVEEESVTDTEDPVITITGKNPDTINVGESWNKPTVTANDNVDGDLTNALSETGSVDNTKAGKNTLTWTVSDAAGNSASASWVLIVKDTSSVDTEAPIITISGDNPDTINVGDTWTDPQVTAYDGKDGDLTAELSKTGSVITGTAGTYQLTWSVSDAAGNNASKTLTVVVKEGVVVTGDSLLIDDFESGEKSQIALWNNDNDGWWYGYVGETSKIEPETTDSINMDQKILESAANNGTLGLYAKMTLEGIDYPSAMVGFSLKTSDQYYDLSQMTSVTLYMKGSGSINVHFATKHVNDLGNDAWGHYGKDVALSNSWQKVTITKEQLKASVDNPKITKTWDEASNEVTSMGFEVTGAKTETGGTVVEVYIDDIWFHGITEIKQ